MVVRRKTHKAGQCKPLARATASEVIPVAPGTPVVAGTPACEPRMRMTNRATTRLERLLLLLACAAILISMNGCTAALPFAAAQAGARLSEKDRLPPDTLRTVRLGTTITYHRRRELGESTGLFLGFAATGDSAKRRSSADSIIVRMDYSIRRVPILRIEWFRIKHGWIGVPVAFGLGLLIDYIVLTRIIGPIQFPS